MSFDDFNKFPMNTRCIKCNHNWGVHSGYTRCAADDGCMCDGFKPKQENPPMVMSPDELKGKLYELGTVDIRSVLRWLNNNHRRTIDAGLLASIRHEAAFKHILDNYGMVLDKVETAYYAIDEAKKKPVPPDIIHDTVREMMGGEPVKPTTDVEANAFKEFMDAQVNVNHSNARTLDSHGRTLNQHEALMLSNQRSLGEHDARIQGLAHDLTGSISALREELNKSRALTLTITFPDDRPPINLGDVHCKLPKLINYLKAGCHVFLTGPAGSGKSTAAQQAAESLGLKFYATSVCQQTTETKFLGYMDAGGVYHPTQFREAYEHGGVYLVDEIDAGNPNVLAVLNAALSNKWCAFADKMVERHPKFRCVAAGNTWGTGRTIQYVGRNPIDAATLNRFVYINWTYDEALETKIAALPEWSTYVQTCRAEIQRRGVNFLITPRASIYGALLLRSGTPVEDVIEDVLLPNLDPDIKRALPEPPVISI